MLIKYILYFIDRFSCLLKKAWLGVLFLFVFAHAQIIYAQCVIPSTNGSFETPTSPVASSSGLTDQVPQAQVPGWTTNDINGNIEIMYNGILTGVSAYAGSQWCEMNAASPGTLTQQITSIPGQSMYAHLAHRGRNGTDVMSVEAGPVGGPYTALGTYSDDSTAWGYYTTSAYTVPVGQTTTQFNFISVSWAGGDPGEGNFLDAVSYTYIPNVPIVTASAPSFCPGSSVTLSSTNGTRYHWSNGDTAMQNIMVTTGGNYFDTVYYATGCFAVSNSVVIQALSTSADTVNAAICQGSSGYTFNGNTYTTTGQYIAHLTNSVGCDSTVTLLLTVNPLPVITITPPKMQLCSGRDTTLTAGGASTYTWAPNTGLSSTTSAAVITSATTTTTYTVTGTSSVGCTATATEIVNVLSSLTVTVTPANPAPVCLGSGIQLTASGATNYSWAPAAGASSGTGAIVTLSPTVATTYTIDGSNGKGCNGSTTVTIDVNPLPTVSAKPDTSVCPGQQVQMYVSGNGISYEWQPASGVDYNTIATPIATVTANTIYTVTSTSGDGCTNTALVTINTYPLPVVSITSNTTIPLGSSIDLFAYGGTKYDWRPDNTLSNLHIYNPIATPTHNTTYYVTIISENGCTVETSVTIDVSDSTLVFVPTAFTPNGDGVNDFLGILARGIFSLDYFKIYNRWGELVFTSNSLTPGWDGNFNGRPEPIGVYAYVLQGIGANGRIIQKKGNITLLR